MKFIRLQLALQTAILAVVFAAPGYAEDKGTAAVSAQDLQTKVEYCQRCHQSSGQGIRAASPIPRLAGQQVEYFENQLRAFIEHRRLHSVMENVAHTLSPAMQRGIAEHFRDLNPKPVGGGQRNSWLAVSKSMKRVFPMPIFRPALPVTVQKRKVTERFPVSQANSMSTSKVNC